MNRRFNRWKTATVILLAGWFICFPATVQPAQAAVVGGPGSCCDTYCDTYYCESTGQTELTLGIELPTFEAVVEELQQVVIDLAETLIMDNLITTVITRITDFVMPDIKDFFLALFQLEIDPDFKNMTRQLNTALLDQVRMNGSLRDAQLQIEAQMSTLRQEYNIRRRYLPSERACTTGTLVGGLARTRSMSRAMSRALEKYGIDNNRVHIRRGKNIADASGGGGIISSAFAAPGDGRVADIVEAWEIYVADFCDGTDNRGAPGCTTAPLANEDLRVGKNLLTPFTIDMEDADTVKIITNMHRNIIEPYIPEIIPPEVVESPPGRKNLMTVYRPTYAKRMSASFQFYDIVAQKSPGSRMGGWLGQIADEVEMPPNLVSDNPSEYEYMDRITFLRYATPNYYMTLGADPEMERLELGAIQSIAARSYYEELERLGMIMAVQIGNEVDDFSSPHSSRIAEEPTR